MVQILMDAGADMNTQDGYYGNALLATSYEGNEKVVQILMDTGAVDQEDSTEECDSIGFGQVSNPIYESNSVRESPLFF